MGRGDNIIATGLARGAGSRGKRIAFGPGRGRTMWDHFSDEVFRGNPNIAQPGTETGPDVEWINYRSGHRIYNSPGKGRWIWNKDFKVVPGEMFFSEQEALWAEEIADSLRNRFVVVEPNNENLKPWAENKRWAADRYDAVAAYLMKSKFPVVQFIHGSTRHKIPGARYVKAPTFRCALALLGMSRLYVGPEGGMHHGAAAVDTPGVVLFGGFIPPSVMGYDTHINLTGGADHACGSWNKCSHCLKAMDSITVDDVIAAATVLLKRRRNRRAR